MKRKAIFLQLLIALFTTLCLAQENDIPHGIDLSNSILEICKSSDVQPETQNLVSNVKNDFPYNISISFPASKPAESYDNLRNTLLIIARQDDVYKKPDFLTNLLAILSAEERDFDIKILLSFGDKQKFSMRNSVFGSISYLNSIDDQTKYSCIIVDLDEEKSLVLPGAGKTVSPTWFIKNVYSAYNKNRLLKIYDNSYISFVYKLNLFREPIQESFLQAGIPCIKTAFGKDVPNEIISDTILNIARNYDYKATSQTDYHSIMYSVFSRQLWLSEGFIIRAILAGVFLALFILIFYGYINKNFTSIAWKRIRTIWFYPFIIYFISLILFFIVSFLLDFMRNTVKIPLSIFTSLSFVLPVIFLIVSRTFLFALRFSPDFKRKTIDHLVFFAGVVNLWFFCLLDISLFPIFIFEFFLALISPTGKNNYFHLIILCLEEIPFIPFIMQIFNNADFTLLSNALTYSLILPVLSLLIILPAYLIFFRLLTGFSFYLRKKEIDLYKREFFNTIFLSVFTAAFIILIILIVPRRFKIPESENLQAEIEFTENIEHSTDISTSKRYVFGDVIRTITIDSKKSITQCSLHIRGKNSSPVLFSDYDFTNEKVNEAVFFIPYEPPSKMEFTYGEAGTNNAIMLTIVYSDYSVDIIELLNTN